MDGQTDGRTELLYQNRASVYCHALKIVECTIAVNERLYDINFAG